MGLAWATNKDAREASTTLDFGENVTMLMTDND